MQQSEEESILERLVPHDGNWACARMKEGRAVSRNVGLGRVFALRGIDVYTVGVHGIAEYWGDLAAWHYYFANTSDWTALPERPSVFISASGSHTL